MNSLKIGGIRLPTSSYLICATPRSGSTLLCEALRNTELAGNPDEYFGSVHIARWSDEWQVTTQEDYLSKVLEHGTGANGVWGGKVMRRYWSEFISMLTQALGVAGVSDADLLNQAFPNLRYVFITRRDKVRQAVSWLKFIQGQAWYWTNSQPQVMENLDFHPEIIRQFMAETEANETAWRAFFAEASIEPFIVTYEELVTAYEETAKAILAFLGVEVPANLVFGERRLKRQADALSETWVEWFLALEEGSPP